jgi:hypothetical protein
VAVAATENSINQLRKGFEKERVSVQLGKSWCARQVPKGQTIDEDEQLASERKGGKLRA